MSAMPEYAMTYVVYWPEVGVLKVGRAWRFHRVQMMTRSGGQIVVLARDTDKTWEAEALRTLRRWFPQAFSNEDQARGLLFMGRGWTECFEVDEHHLQLAVDLCFEGFARGNDQGVNEERATEDQRGGSAVPRVPAGPDGREADGDRPVAAHRRPRPPRGSSGAACGRDLSRRGGDRARARASADAGRVRVPGLLPARRDRVPGAAAPAESGRAPRVVELPRSTSSRTFANVRGCGGSAGESGGAGACRAGRAGVGVGAVGGRAREQAAAASETAAAGCSAHRMPRSPLRQVQGLRTLRHRTPQARSLGPGGPLRRTDDRVRADAAAGRGVEQ